LIIPSASCADAPRRSGFGGASSYETPRSETASSWRRETPLEPAAPPRSSGFRRDGDREGGFRDREGGFRRDGDREGGFRRDGDREGGFRRDDRYGSSSGERPRLELKPRSVDSSAANNSSSSSSTS